MAVFWPGKERENGSRGDGEEKQREGERERKGESEKMMSRCQIGRIIFE